MAAMVRAGHTVQACAPEPGDDVAAALQKLGVDYRQVKLDRTGMNPVRDLRFLISFSRFLRRSKPDLFFGYNVKSVTYGSLAARWARVPRVFSLISGLGYSFLNGDLKSRLANLAARTLYRLALPHNHAVFFQNRDDRDLFIRLGLLPDKSRAAIINGSGVDLDRFQEAPVSSGPPLFLLIARLIRDKGILEYVEAAAILKKRHPQARFQLLGRHDSNPSAIGRQQLQSWQRDGVIEYLGETSNVAPHLAAAHVYVLPSYREGTPLTVLEAMATGRPIVTTDVPGCRETVVPGENGFLVPAKSAACLAEAMERFIRAPELIRKMGRHSREIAVEKFDVRKVNSVILKRMGL